MVALTGCIARQRKMQVLSADGQCNRLQWRALKLFFVHFDQHNMIFGEKEAFMK